MAQPILVTGAAGGLQGSTGRIITGLLRRNDIPVRAFVHTMDDRCDELRRQGAEIVEGDLLDPRSVRAALKGVRRAYFTYPVADGLMEAAAIFAASARDAALELVVNNTQFQGLPGEPSFRDLQLAPSFRNLQHRLVDRIFDWAQVGAVHLQAPPYFENVRAFVRHTVAQQDTVYMPWGDGSTVIPLIGAEDVAQVAANLLAAPSVPAQDVYPSISETPTVSQIIDALSNALGRSIRYVPITDEQWAEALKGRLNEHALDHLAHLWAYFRKGEERFQSTDVVRAVTGRRARTLEEFFRANADSMAAVPRP